MRAACCFVLHQSQGNISMFRVVFGPSDERRTGLALFKYLHLVYLLALQLPDAPLCSAATLTDCMLHGAGGGSDLLLLAHNPDFHLKIFLILSSHEFLAYVGSHSSVILCNSFHPFFSSGCLMRRGTAVQLMNHEGSRGTCPSRYGH